MLRVNSEDVIIEIIVREASGAKIESYKFGIKNKTKTINVMNLLKHKYGLYDSKKDKDIDWLNKKNW